MKIKFYNEDTPVFKLNADRIKTNLEYLIESENKVPGEISVIFCSDDYLIEVNKKFLDHDYYTDIITFDYCEGNKISGDVFISVDRVKENAEEFQVDFSNELSRVIFHGILHLIGYKDKTDSEKSEMRSKENYYLEKLLNN